MRKQLLGLICLVVLVGCGSSPDALPRSHGRGPAPFDPDTTYAPSVTASALSAAVTNPLYPAPVGASWAFQSRTDEGLETTDVRVLEGTHPVWGANARVVRDSVYVDGVLKEDTLDWYGQDTTGHVWYLGEDTAEYGPTGEVTSRAGAWASGEGGALPGVVMLADPQVDDVYRQEYLAGEAEDLAEVTKLGVAVQVPAGAFSGCVETRDRSALDLSVDERKYYCPGVGLVLEVEGDTRVELVSYSGL